MEETKEQFGDTWPELDQALDEVFTPPNKCQDNPHQDMIDGVIKIYTNADQRSCV